MLGLVALPTSPGNPVNWPIPDQPASSSTRAPAGGGPVTVLRGTRTRFGNELQFYVDCPARAQATLYLCRLCAVSFDPWRLQHRLDADGYFSEYRYSGNYGRLAVHR